MDVVVDRNEVRVGNVYADGVLTAEAHLEITKHLSSNVEPIS